jgi:hypothetical protein
MDARNKYVYAALAAVILVLLIVCALNYLALQSANQELEHYRQQQKEIATAIMADYAPDMQAARLAWIQAHQDEYRTLNNEGIIVEADYVSTPYYSAVLDPASPYYVIVGPAGDVEAGQVKIGLGQYYQGNYTRASGWTVTYVVNRSTHNVAGFTASLIQTVAYDNYIANVQPGIAGHLGVAEGTITGDSPVTLDTSYLAAAEKLAQHVLAKGYDHQYGGPYKDYNRTTGQMLMWGIADTAKAWWQMSRRSSTG